VSPFCSFAKPECNKRWSGRVELHLKKAIEDGQVFKILNCISLIGSGNAFVSLDRLRRAVKQCEQDAEKKS